MKNNDGNVHSGHRKRMRDAFFTGGDLSGMSEVQVLEFLLFYSIPRADTNILSHALLKKFGSLNAVLRATPEMLMTVDGVGERTAALIKLVSEIAKNYRYESSPAIKQIHSTAEAAEFLRPRFNSRNEEKMILILLDNSGKILKCIDSKKGDSNSAYIGSRKILNELMSCKARAAILAHNHPSGLCAPSKSDIKTTVNLVRLLNEVNVKLLNHIIITDDDYLSFADNSKLSSCLNNDEQKY